MKLFYTSRFKRDYKRVVKQGKDVKILEGVIEKLVKGVTLPAKYSDHKLFGKWSKHRECHLETDWLLIYRTTKELLVLERTGSHSELY